LIRALAANVINVQLLLLLREQLHVHVVPVGLMPADAGVMERQPTCSSAGQGGRVTSSGLREHGLREHGG
jgi:hypothetical protein